MVACGSKGDAYGREGSKARRCLRKSRYCRQAIEERFEDHPWRVLIVRSAARDLSGLDVNDKQQALKSLHSIASGIWSGHSVKHVSAPCTLHPAPCTKHVRAPCTAALHAVSSQRAHEESSQTAVAWRRGVAYPHPVTSGAPRSHLAPNIRIPLAPRCTFDRSSRGTQSQVLFPCTSANSPRVLASYGALVLTSCPTLDCISRRFACGQWTGRTTPPRSPSRECVVSTGAGLHSWMGRNLTGSYGYHAA